MRLAIKYMAFVLLFLSVGCEEDFNIKTDYVPKYALNCIVRADTAYQTATVVKSYDVGGFNPYAYTEDPFISGADIRIWRKETVFKLRDSTIQRTDTSRFNSPQKFYYTSNFAPGSDDFLEIRAVLDNGKVLYGNTIVPKKTKWDSASTKILKPGSDQFSVSWLKNGNYGWFFLRLKLNYKIGSGVTQSVELPVRFDGDVPFYPLPTRNSGVAFEWAAFERVLLDISAGETDKSQYLVYGVSVELLVLDENLSKYFSNMNGYMDDFTVRVDQNDFSNIEGGLGIFGSYIKQIGGILISEDYLTSLGYRHQ